MDEDQRTAVNIGVTLSTQLITASLTMIAVVGAFVTFALDKREIGFWYSLVVGTSFVCFICSIVLGGKGIDTARKAGHKGNWDITVTKPQFGWQANFAFLGILLFVISVFIGRAKTDGTVFKIQSLDKQVEMLRARDSLLKMTVEHQADKIVRLETRLDSLTQMMVGQKGRFPYGQGQSK